MDELDFRVPIYFRWTFDGFHGLSGIPWRSMDIYGYLWISKEIHGNPWKSMEVHGRSMEVHGGPWRSMEVHEVHGSPWKSMEVPGYPWKSMDFLRFSWILVHFRGFSRIFVEIHGNPWKSVEKFNRRSNWLKIAKNNFLRFLDFYPLISAFQAPSCLANDRSRRDLSIGIENS